MPVILEIDDELTRLLQSHANIRDVSLARWALLILENTSQRPDRPETWTELNSRRLDLIRQKHAHGLSDQDKAELEQLQATAATVCELADRRRWDHLRTFEEAAGISSLGSMRLVQS